MAEDVSFLKEIDDSLRADRVEQFWQRHSLKIALLCAAVVVATAVVVLWKNHQNDEHARQTTDILHAQALFDAGKFDDAAAAYAQGENGEPGLAALSRLHRAHALLNAGHKDNALGLYKELAGDTHIEPSLRDLAALQAAMLDPASSDALLAQAAQSGHPYAATAMQLQAARLAETGKKAEARVVLSKMLAGEAPQPALKARAEELGSMLAAEPHP